MIPSSLKTKSQRFITPHEGRKKRIYIDTKNKITGGIGRNLTDRDFFDSEIDLMFQNDVNYFYDFLMNTYPWYKNLNEARQIVLLDMVFMGTKTFQEFHNMIAALEKGSFILAAHEMLKSDWAKEVGKRATEDAEVMISGVLPNDK